MKRDRNHEGYHDPTAGRAIQRASRRRRGVVKRDALTYQIGEEPTFWMTVEMLSGSTEIILLHGSTGTAER